MTIEFMMLALIIFCVVVIVARRFYVSWFLRKLSKYVATFFSLLEELHSEKLDDRFPIYEPHIDELIVTLPKHVSHLHYALHLWGYRQMIHNKELWDEMQISIPFGWFLLQLKELTKEESRKK